MAADDGFLTRWSRRKVQALRGDPAVPPLPAAESTAAPPVDETAAGEVPATVARPDADDTAPPPPTLEQAQQLTPDADFSRYVMRDVDPQVRNTALKSLFSDPRFNVMDGLDTYIDDYGKPDPLPPGMLRQMVQSAMLGLFKDDPAPAAPPAAGDTIEMPLPQATAADDAPLPQPDTATDEDTDLRLQPDDDAGRAGAEPGAGEDPGRQH